MINRLCKRLNQNIEVRQSLSSLRQEIKDSSKRELLLSWIHDGDLDLSVFLENEDAKTRKNAALLIGDLALSSESDAVFHAYQTEDTRFVKEAYLTALKSLNAAPYVDVFRKRYEELSLYEASDDDNLPQKGEWKIASINGERYGVYRDKKGYLYVVDIMLKVKIKLTLKLCDINLD